MNPLASYFNFENNLPVQTNEQTQTETTSKNMNLHQIQPYQGTTWSNVPAISNIIFAPYEAVVAIGALFKAHALNDTEAEIDASLRLAQQPFSFLGALGTLAVTVLEIGVYYKSFHFQDYLPSLKIAASSLGLTLCAFEFFFESMGVYRALDFMDSLYYSSAPIPNLQKLQNPDKIKKGLINWTRKIIENPNLLQRDLSLGARKAIVPRLEQFIQRLEDSSTPLSEPEIRDQAQLLLTSIEDEILVADLNYIKQNYFSISPLGAQKIDELARQRFPELNSEELAAKKQEMTSQILTIKGSNLARRIQPWLVHEIHEKLDPILEKLSDPDSEVRNQAKIEARDLLEQMDIQAKKKMLAHVIGLIAIAFVTAGLIAGLIACPFLIPIVLLAIGGAISLGRYYFSLGFWNSRGWEFEISECVPSLVKWLYRKIMEPEIAVQNPWPYRPYRDPFEKPFQYTYPDFSNFTNPKQKTTFAFPDLPLQDPLKKLPQYTYPDFTNFINPQQRTTFAFPDLITT